MIISFMRFEWFYFLKFFLVLSVFVLVSGMGSFFFSVSFMFMQLNNMSKCFFYFLKLVLLSIDMKFMLAVVVVAEDVLIKYMMKFMKMSLYEYL